MDHLAQSQNRIRIIVEGNGDEPDPYAGTGLGEEMEAAAATSSSLRGEASGLAELARRFGDVLADAERRRGLREWST